MPEGLRERKKQRTREAIVDAAMRLFTERGFEHTTIADIAAEADIAPRTFFSYFPSKEDVVFADFAQTIGSFEGRLLERREPGETAMDALRAWIADLLASVDFTAEEHRCRRALIRDNPAIAARDRHIHAQFEQVLTEAVAADLGARPEDLRPRMVAAAAAAALDSLESEFEDDTLAILDHALVFLRGGIAALQADERA